MAELEKAYAADPSIFQHAPTWQKGLQLEHEKWIVANLGQGWPTFITDYPKAMKPFYMLPSKIGGDEDKVGTASLRFHQALVALLGSHRIDAFFRVTIAQLRLAFAVMTDEAEFQAPWVARDRSSTPGSPTSAPSR